MENIELHAAAPPAAANVRRRVSHQNNRCHLMRHSAHWHLLNKVTRRILVGRFEKLMSDNKGGIVDFPLRFIPDDVLQASLRELRAKCNNAVTDEELVRGAELSKGRIGGQIW